MASRKKRRVRPKVKPKASKLERFVAKARLTLASVLIWVRATALAIVAAVGRHVRFVLFVALPTTAAIVTVVLVVQTSFPQYTKLAFELILGYAGLGALYFFIPLISRRQTKLYVGSISFAALVFVEATVSIKTPALWSATKPHDTTPIAVAACGPLGPDRVRVSVATIDSDYGPALGVTQTLFARLHQWADRYPNVEIAPLNQSIRPQDGDKLAFLLGNACHSTVVLWGYQRTVAERTELEAHVAILQQSSNLIFRHLSDVRLSGTDALTDANIASINERELSYHVTIPVEKFISANVEGHVSTVVDYLVTLTRGVSAYQAHNYTESASLYRDAISVAAQSREINAYLAWFSLGDALDHLAAYGDARKAYLNALALRPNLADAHDGLADVAVEVGNVPLASRELSEALAINADDIQARASRAGIRVVYGDASGAIADCDFVIHRHPDVGVCYLT